MLKEIKVFVIRNLKWFILCGCLIGFLALAENVCNQEMMDADIVGYKIVSEFFISDFSTPIVKIITNFGGASVLIMLTIIFLVCMKNRKLGISIAVNLCLIASLNVLLKQMVQRPRPMEHRLVNETGYSFPSGHSMASMAFYGFIIYLIFRYINNKYLKWSAIAMLSLLIAVIGVSRIYLGVHYTSDVLAGFLISICYLIIYISALNKFVLRGEQKVSSDKNGVMKAKVKELINSFCYAGQGIIASLSERNVKIHIIIMLLVIVMGTVLKISRYEWSICIICFAVVIGGELFNTAIEIVVDMVMPHKDERAKMAKDISAGGVLVLAIGAAVVGIIIFLPKIAEAIISSV